MITNNSNHPSAFTDTLYHTKKGCKPVWQLCTNGTITMQSEKSTHSIPRRRYEEALALLVAFTEQARALRQTPSIAWVAQTDAPLVPNLATVASWGIALEHFLFVETDFPQRTFQSLCAQNRVDAILYDAPANRAVLQVARRWVRPVRQPELMPADALATQRFNKLVILVG